MTKLISASVSCSFNISQVGFMSALHLYFLYNYPTFYIKCSFIYPHYCNLSKWNCLPWHYCICIGWEASYSKYKSWFLVLSVSLFRLSTVSTCSTFDKFTVRCCPLGFSLQHGPKVHQ